MSGVRRRARQGWSGQCTEPEPAAPGCVAIQAECGKWTLSSGIINLQHWVGRSETVGDNITATPCAALAATLG